jgi:hypothetical protein
LLEKIHVNLRFIDWIWRVKGSLPLDARQSPADAFERLDPLFQAAGTTYRIEGDTLTFDKKSPLAQDKMSVYDHGALKVEHGAAGPVLRWWMTSKPLLFCFLAPLLFLGFGQLTIFVGELQKPTAEEIKQAEEKAKKAEKEMAQKKLNPIDEFLGAPAPEKPKSEAEKKKDKAEKDKKKEEGPSPTPAYVFAGIFSALYLLGRWLEPWLIRREFRRRLSGDALPVSEMPLAK